MPQPAPAAGTAARDGAVCGYSPQLLQTSFRGAPNARAREDGGDHAPEAEAGIDRVELRREQTGEVARVAGRAGGTQGKVLDPAVDAVKAEIEPACADALARQSRRQILDQPRDGAGE